MAEFKQEGGGGRGGADADAPPTPPASDPAGAAEEDAASSAQGSLGRLGGQVASVAGLKGTGRATSTGGV